MSTRPSRLVRGWMQVGARWLPFADAATDELPLPRLLRLGLFQVSVGLAVALLNGTLNRVMIVELHISSSLIAAMVALPVLVAPLRALVGVRSDAHRSVLGWRRVPYLWFGTLLQFGGLAVLPFALILLSGDTNGTRAAALVLSALAFTLVGVGVHTTQTAGLALATDLAPPHARPRAIALLHLQQLAGLVLSATLLGRVLTPFGQIRLIQVVQGAAAVTMALNLVALWKQEPRRRRGESSGSGGDDAALDMRAALRALSQIPGAVRLLVGVGLGAAAFGMQDILLEPYGGQVLHLGVGATSALTALTAAGAIAAFAFAAHRLERGADPIRLAAAGAVVGIGAFAAVIFAAPLASPLLFRVGAAGIGLGGGLLAVSTLVRVMDLQRALESGVLLGAWGAVQATCGGAALLAGALVRDAAARATGAGALGSALSAPSVPYSVVYHVEIALLFATLVALGPLARPARAVRAEGRQFGLAELPG